MDAKTNVTLGDPALFRQQCYVNGGWTDARSGDAIEVDNPATREVIGTVPAFGRDETRAAIEAADAAWSGWRSRPAKERAGLLRRWFELLMACQDDLAVLMTTEQGKPRAESRAAVAALQVGNGLFVSAFCLVNNLDAMPLESVRSTTF